jgi:rhamnosyltransferase
MTCIYHLSDPTGHVDDYVVFFLREIKKVADKIVVVANEGLPSACISLLSEAADAIITAGNVSRKEAFRIGLSEFRQDVSASIDNIVYADDSIFGPFYPIERVMKEGLIGEIEKEAAGRDLCEHSRLDLFKAGKCPFMNVDFFADSSYISRIENTLGHEASEVFRMLRRDGFYPTDMILKHLLRTKNLKDIRDTLHFNYILPSVSSIPDGDLANGMKVALIMHIHYPECVRECRTYAESMPHTSDIFITTDSEHTVSLIKEEFSILKCRKLTIKQIENRGRDVSALLVGSRDFVHDYDLVCFAHDKKSSQIAPYTIGRDFAYKCFESILSTSGYVDNIIATFKEEPLLGMLQPHPPYHGRYYIHYGDEWTINYEFTILLAEKMGINVDIRRDKTPPAPFGTMFWFKPSALKKAFLAPWGYDDYPPEPHDEDGTLLHALERLYPYIVQDAGYYVGHAAPDHLASIEEDNLAYLLQTLKNDLKITLHGSLPIPRENTGILNMVSPANAIKKKLRKAIKDKKRKRDNMERYR